MAMKRHRQPLEVVSDLNITNLLDTAFILLITFMLVTPQLDHAVSVELAEVQHSPPVNVTQDQKPIFITIKAAGQGRDEEWIYLNDKQILLEDIPSYLERALLSNKEPAVIINSDKKASSGVFIQVIGAVKNSGITKISLGVNPQMRKK